MGSSWYGTAWEHAGSVGFALLGKRSAAFRGLDELARSRLLCLATIAMDRAVLTHSWEASSVLELCFWPLGIDWDAWRRSSSLGGEQAETPHPDIFTCWTFSNRINCRQKSLLKEENLYTQRQRAGCCPGPQGCCVGCYCLLGSLPGQAAARCSADGGPACPVGLWAVCTCQHSWSSMQHKTVKRTSRPRAASLLFPYLFSKGLSGVSPGQHKTQQDATFNYVSPVLQLPLLTTKEPHLALSALLCSPSLHHCKLSWLQPAVLHCYQSR